MVQSLALSQYMSSFHFCFTKPCSNLSRPETVYLLSDVCHKTGLYLKHPSPFYPPASAAAEEAHL